MSSDISGIVFSEIEDFRPYSLISALDFYDGVVGLGPPRARSHTWYNGSRVESNAIRLPNLLHQLLNSPSVSPRHKTMLLRFPANNETKGTLTLGEPVPTALDFSLPLVGCDLSSPDCTASWDVKLNTIRLLGSPPQSLALGLPMSITTEPSLALKLQRQVAEQIRQYLGLPPNPSDTFVDCSERHNLPDIALEFAGHELLLGWEDYSEWYKDPNSPESKPECAVNIVEVEDGQKSSIGMGLLQKYDVVFDMEKSVVGFRAVKNKRLLQKV